MRADELIPVAEQRCGCVVIPVADQCQWCGCGVWLCGDSGGGTVGHPPSWHISLLYSCGIDRTAASQCVLPCSPSSQPISALSKSADATDGPLMSQLKQG